jgi:putative PIN family toxin of toxin-antitoxin system
MTEPTMRSAPRAVFDTNLLVSYLLVHRPPIATLIDEHLAHESFTLVSAAELLEELARVPRYPRLQRYYDAATRDRFVALIAALSELVELPAEIPPISRDPDDDRVIACAVAGRADVIVSGDDDLLDLEQVGGIPILTAAQFLAGVESNLAEDQ